MRALAVLCALAVASGCLGAPDAGPAGSSAPADVPPTDEAGKLLVTVVTNELEPVAGAQVVVQQLDLRQATGTDGVATFDAVPAGTYTVLAAKPGFKTQEERGRTVILEAGGIVEARFTLHQVLVTTDELTYKKTLTLRGFISCSVAVPGAAHTPCGRGPVKDPNDNSTHPWQVENHQLASVVMEAVWNPSIAFVPQELHLSLNKAYTCTNTGCTIDGQLAALGGVSPLHLVFPAPGKPSAGNSFGTKPEEYPKTAYTIVRAYCVAPCNVSVAIQQGYTGYLTAFYGEPAPDGFKYRP